MSTYRCNVYLDIFTGSHEADDYEYLTLCKSYMLTFVPVAGMIWVNDNIHPSNTEGLVVESVEWVMDDDYFYINVRGGVLHLEGVKASAAALVKQGWVMEDGTPAAFGTPHAKHG